ncbi:uncharacterized protein [Nicotiana sylvestris]|uniref:uncharacterized protein n=1 Tax=Nicotiana sylvestris TaxID=4096 RepID=UPI00388CC934
MEKVKIIKERLKTAQNHQKSYLDVRRNDLEFKEDDWEGIHKHKTTDFSLGMDDGRLGYQGRLCVPSIDGLRERIMVEAHTSRHSVHPGSTKMCHDLKEVYWWNDMKRNGADFVAKRSKCQQVKAKHQRPGGL